MRCPLPSRGAEGPEEGHCPSWGLLPEPQRAHQPGKGLPQAADSERGLTLTSAEWGIRQRQVWPWKSGGALTSTSQGSRGASLGGLAAPGSAGGNGVLPTLLERVLRCCPAPGAAGDWPTLLPIPMWRSHQGPILCGLCCGHPKVLSILLPPWHSPHHPPALQQTPQACAGTWDQLSPKNQGQGSPTVLSRLVKSSTVCRCPSQINL